MIDDIDARFFSQLGWALIRMSIDSPLVRIMPIQYDPGHFPEMDWGEVAGFCPKVPFLAQADNQ